MTDEQRIYRQKTWLHIHGVRCQIMEATIHPDICQRRAKMPDILSQHDMTQNWNIGLVGRYLKNDCFGCERYREGI